MSLRVIVPIYIHCELKLGQLHCLLDRDRWLLNNGIGNRVCVRMRDRVEKRAGLTQTGDVWTYQHAKHALWGGGLQGSGRIRTSEGSLSFENVYKQLRR